MWTPQQRTLFIDVKTGRPNRKYDGKVLKDGYTLVIQNLTEKDLNVSYSCLYGVTYGEIKFLLEEDVFTSISTTPPKNTTGNAKLSPGEIASIITGIIMVFVLVLICIYFLIQRYRGSQIGDISDIKEKIIKVESEQEKVKQNIIKEEEKHSDLNERVIKIEKEEEEVIPKNIRGIVSVRMATNTLELEFSLQRQQLLQHLKQLDKSQQETLASDNDTVLPKEHHGSGDTPLIRACYHGYTDMIQWMLQNNVDVNQCRDDGVTGLIYGNQNGYTDIVKLLLERNPNIDLCQNDGSSPLYIASQNGHTDICVKSTDNIDRLGMAESGEDVVQPIDEADNRSFQSSQTDLQSLSSPKTEFQERSICSWSNKPQPIQTEEDNLLQAACTILYTVPRAIEHYIDREYKGGFLQAIRDYKDQLKTKLIPEEWDLLSKHLVTLLTYLTRFHHRLYHFYDQIIQDTILDNEVLDLLISRCILRKEDRAEIEHHPRQSDRNKCILDFLILRPEDSYSVLLEVLKESSTCSKDLIECMEGQLYSHHKVVSKSKVRSSITGFHSVRIQKNYHNLTQNLSNTECIIDSLISKGILNPDDRSEIVSSGVQTKINRKLIDYVRSEQDYQFFLTALTEDPSNAKLASDLELTNITSDELKLLQTGAILPSLTNAPGFQTMVTLVSMVTAVQISNTKPENHDISLSADLYRLTSWYKKMLKMTVIDSHQYQQLVQTVKEILVRLGEDDDSVDITWNVGMQKEVRKVLCGLKEKEEHTDLKEKMKKMEIEQDEVIPKNIRGISLVYMIWNFISSQQKTVLKIRNRIISSNCVLFKCLNYVDFTMKIRHH
ncbi:unnamed protein product [Mytilus edulis]|uniref:CARD domain-containing protein n=1 Tax=Mytilus edulis TaxID=6550 RepID=A0A8S3RME3_MYTED|nr:unnamed protein product [Mytilus edulis]